MGHLAKVFELNRAGFNLQRGVGVTVVMLVPLIILALIHQPHYWLGVAFGALFVGLCDPGGHYAYRVTRMAAVAAPGALLTLLGCAIGGGAWGWVVLAIFMVTLLSGLTATFGQHGFVAALLLNIWFVIALSLPAAYQAAGVPTIAWAQALAWLTGSALAVTSTFVFWLVRGRTARPQPAADMVPGSTARIPLTGRLALFAVIRAIAVSLSGAIAFGLQLPDADWMPVATLAAMKPSLQQSTLVAGQRLVGAALGAAVAALFLVTVSNRIALGVVIVVLAAIAVSIRTVNYALYCAGIAGAVLVAMGVPHPANLGDEGRRILFTFVGVGIAVVVMLLATLLQTRSTANRPAPGTTDTAG